MENQIIDVSNSIVDPSGTLGTLLSFRITHEEIEQKYLQTYYIYNIQNYLKTKSVDILSSTLGLHKNSAYPHIHYHFLIKTRKLPKALIQDWKYNYSNGKIPIHTPVVSKDTLNTLPCLWSYKCGTQSKINISIRQTLAKTQEDIQAFLQYPFKEKYPIQIGCMNVDVKALTIRANTLYLDAEKKRKQKETRERESVAVYTKIQNFIIEKQFTEYNEVLQPVLAFCRDFEKPIHYRKVVEHTQTICYRLKLIDLETICQKYYI
jgi:hypothetical protein